MNEPCTFDINIPVKIGAVSRYYGNWYNAGIPTTQGIDKIH